MLPTDIIEISSIIGSLRNTGNSLFDISVSCLKNNNWVFSEHMTFLYNFSIETECFPDILKIARLVSGHKSGPQDIIDNYRPISNLPSMSKIFEKLTLKRFNAFVESHSLISESQFGFQRGRNITQAAIKLTTLIIRAYHDKMYSACFFLDLRKAFDTVDHAILLGKLNHIGFRGNSNRYMSSYLTNRKQYLMVNGIKSNERMITKGVPQGSILGPLLFCLYINDIVHAVECDVVLFADDAAFILTAPSLPLLYQKIRKLFTDLNKYLEMNKLVPNLRKSKLMYFTSRPPPERLENLMFGNTAIDWIIEIKYLGLNLNNKMSFSTHIDRTVSQISRYTGVFYQLSKTVPQCILRLLYSSFILPHLTLHIVIWGASPDFHLNKLIVKQNGLLRAILRVPYDNGRPLVGTLELYRSLGVLTLRNLFKLCLFKFLILVLNGSLPFFYNLLLNPLISVHGYPTRGGIFRHPLISCEVERRSVAYQLVLLFEEVNADMYENVSVHTASFKYKKHLMLTQ